MLAKLLAQSEAAVVFSGAGMSTESGLQDFRSADRGMWNNRNPVELADIEAIDANRSEFVRFYRWRIEEMLKHEPNEGHRIVAKWEEQGRLKGIITQNVENYHEQAGASNIAKLHGDLGTLRCMGCGKRFGCEVYISPLEQTVCGCGGFIRPNVVLFGERLPRQPLESAESMLASTDLFIVLGSSLQVSPANRFPLKARARGAKLVIVNLEPTPLDAYADLLIRESIGHVLGTADRELETI